MRGKGVMGMAKLELDRERMGLTRREGDALGAIVFLMAQQGFPPTLRGIGRAMSLGRGVNWVVQLLHRLEVKGFVEIESPRERRARALRVLKPLRWKIVP